MYRVIWLQEAVGNLADVWSHADSSTRKAITAAAHTLETMLQSDPLGHGESRSGNGRIMFVGPLGVYLEIEVMDRIVLVMKVWCPKPRGK
jgi:hypothetical protein